LWFNVREPSGEGERLSDRYRQDAKKAKGKKHGLRLTRRPERMRSIRWGAAPNGEVSLKTAC